MNVQSSMHSNSGRKYNATWNPIKWVDRNFAHRGTKPNGRACFYSSPSHSRVSAPALADSPADGCLQRARLPRIFPFTFYSGKQGGILAAVQTRSPIARGNWVDIGNESKEQITQSKGWLALRSSGAPTSGCWHLAPAFVSAGIGESWKQRGAEARFDVRMEHDFTALTGNSRNALDNPTSVLDLLDPFLLFSPSHSIVASCCSSGPGELHAVDSVCDDSLLDHRYASVVSDFRDEPIKRPLSNFRLSICIFNDEYMCGVVYLDERRLGIASYSGAF